MAYRDVPALVARLRESDNIQHEAFEFLVLTLVRLSNVLEAKWDEFDLDAVLWVIPAAKMKGGVEHRVPLVPRALEILDKMREHRTNDLVFPGRAGRVMAATTFGRVLSALGVEDATPQGFRSSFHDWAHDETHAPREIAEGCLAHVVGSAVERAYRRSDALEKRRALMTAWAQHCEPKSAGADVLLFPRTVV